MEYSTILNAIQIFKEVAITTAAVVTSGVALYGVKKWKIEHQSKIHFDSARALLKAVYSVRNHFEMVRSGWLHDSEHPEDLMSKHPSKQTHEDKANAKRYIYKNRLEPLTNAMSELDIALIEGELFWSAEVKN